MPLASQNVAEIVTGFVNTPPSAIGRVKRSVPPLTCFQHLIECNSVRPLYQQPWIWKYPFHKFSQFKSYKPLTKPIRDEVTHNIINIDLKKKVFEDGEKSL